MTNKTTPADDAIETAATVPARKLWSKPTLLKISSDYTEAAITPGGSGDLGLYAS